MKKLKIISIAVLALSLHSCRKDYLYVAPIVPPPANLSFATSILPLISTYGCAQGGCHDGGQVPDLTPANAFTSLTTGTTYVNTASPASSMFYIAVTSAYTGSSGQMPAGAAHLTANEQATILAWITQGAHP